MVGDRWFRDRRVWGRDELTTPPRPVNRPFLRVADTPWVACSPPQPLHPSDLSNFPPHHFPEKAEKIVFFL